MKRVGESDGSRSVRRGARAWVVAVLMLGSAGAVGLGGCGPSKKRPKEADVSVVPAAVLESFRRERPNSIILEAREVRGKDGAEWRIKQYTPRAEKKVTYYTVDGDKLRGW